MKKCWTVLGACVFTLVASSCDSDSGSDTPPPPPPPAQLKLEIVGANDLGLHWIADEYSTFAILPPHNVVRAQVLRQGGAKPPELLDDSKIDVRYRAVPTLGGAPNSSSVGKTDFWDHAEALFGRPFAPGEGLGGLFMPADAPHPGPQPMEFDAARREWVAQGIPIVPIDDAGKGQNYPLLRLTAYAKGTSHALAHVDVVVPVAFDSDCKRCHATGEIAAREPSTFPGTSGLVWSTAEPRGLQAKENILKLHDAWHGTELFDSRPVLCAECHYVAPLDFESDGPSEAQCLHATLSEAMHRVHGLAQDAHGNLVFGATAPTESTCYLCHPGHEAQALRGAMHAGGRECVDCHGTLLSVAGVYPLLEGGSLDGKWDGLPRRAWIDMPRCQACHTGDAVLHLEDPDALVSDDRLRLQQTYRMRDESASSFLAPNPRFAENVHTRYRDSLGHGGLACEQCHGSTHGEWPNEKLRTPDNVAAFALQKHGGVLIECRTCHPGETLPLNVSGPHGLHNVADARFVEHHEAFFVADPRSCQACHGLDWRGTVLSRAHAARKFELPSGKVIHFVKDEPIGCDRCHAPPPVATGLQGLTQAPGVELRP